MIDNHVFSAGLTLLCTHYNRELQPEVLRIWKEYLDTALTTDQFQQAVKVVVLEHRFFPTAKDLVEAVCGSSDIQALIDWELCLKAAARTDRAMISKLTPQGQSALHIIGGLHKLGLVEELRLEWVKKEFVAAWKATPVEQRPLPQSRNPELPPPSTNLGKVGQPCTTQLSHGSQSLTKEGCPTLPNFIGPLDAVRNLAAEKSMNQNGNGKTGDYKSL